MEQASQTSAVAGPAHYSLISMRTEVRALIALGWVPSADEPWRIYPLRGDTFSTLTTKAVWAAMHELMSEVKK
jgi:hypothetical protein